MKKLLKGLCALLLATSCVTSLPVMDVEAESSKINLTTDMLSGSAAQPSSEDSNAGNIAKAADGDNGTYWCTKADSLANAYFMIDLQAIYEVDQLNYTKRYDATAKYGCTGNAKNLKVLGSIDGDSWFEIKNIDTEDGITKITFDSTKVRFIKLTSTKIHHWQGESQPYLCVAEVEIFGNKIATTNLALNQPVDAFYTETGVSSAKGGDCPMNRVVDGTSNNFNNYGEFGSDNNLKSQYVQIDLGENKLVTDIEMWRYWNDGRTYGDTVIALYKESDTEFSRPQIVYNADERNVHGLGQGEHLDYAESASGKKFVLEDWLEARFVRVYMYGVTSSGATTNHVCEIKVNGYSFTQEEFTTNAIKLLSKFESYILDAYYGPNGEEGATADTDGAQARYVDSLVGTIKAQYLTYVDETGTDKYSIRFVSSVASINPDTVGFEITIGSKTADKSTRTVYSTINEKYDSKEGTTSEVLPTNPSDVFGEYAVAFHTCTLSGIPTSGDALNTDITVKPYWIPYDGAQRVYGKSRTVTMQELIDLRNAQN